MPKYFAFLRAINVGGHTVKMDYLRSLFETMGLANVETFIASGNVIFETATNDKQALERKIEDFLHQALGYEVATFIRSAAELRDVAAYKPFGEAEPGADGASLYIAFLAGAPGEEARRKLLAFTTEIDDFHINGGEVYWLRRNKLGESKFSGALLEKALGMPATLRNSTTVRKLASKYA
jgi:uncharacterized protein (DUF1697 family)